MQPPFVKCIIALTLQNENCVFAINVVMGFSLGGNAQSYTMYNVHVGQEENSCLYYKQESGLHAKLLMNHIALLS